MREPYCRDPALSIAASPEFSVDVAVVGAGPAGLLAARLMEAAGLEASLLDERLGSIVWAAFGPGELGVLRDGRAVVVRPRALLLAPGMREIPAPVPGWTLPGVLTAGAARRQAPAGRVVVAGEGVRNFLLAQRLHRAGAEVVALVHAGPGLAPAELRRAGVPVLQQSRVAAVLGDARVSGCVLETPGGRRTVACETVVLGGEPVPATELARQLGCRHVFVDRQVGFLRTETAADGATSVPGVWSVAGAGATHRVMLAASSIGTFLGRPVLPGAAPGVSPGANVRRARRLLRRAERGVEPASRFDVGGMPDETVVCPCEGTTAGRLRRVLATHGADAGTAKRLTRMGMGVCQGRGCAAVLARLVEHAGGAAAGAGSFFAPRAPVRPVPLGAVAAEQPEWGGHRRSTPPAVAPRPARARPRWAAPRRADVLVVGAGVVGACVARALALDGASVLLVDRDAPGQQASTANAGSLHVQLLSFDFGAKAEAGGGPAAETLRLGPGAIRLWQEFAATCSEPFDLAVTGGLMLADTDAQLGFLRRKAALEARHGVETVVVDGHELRAMEPHVSPGAAGAAFCAAEGKIDPLRATFAVLADARRAGVAVEADAPVLAIEREANAFRVETGAGPVRCGRIVNCAGAWAPRISAMAGRPIPVAGAPLQMMVTAPGPRLTDRLLAHADRHLSLKQTARGALLIGGGWSAGLDERTGGSRPLRWAVEGNAFAACHVLPAAASFPVVRIWAGMNINIDGAPILGEMPGAPGFWNCVTSNGFTLAPVVAAMTAEAMRTGADLAPFTLGRF